MSGQPEIFKLLVYFFVFIVTVPEVEISGNDDSFAVFGRLMHFLHLFLSQLLVPSQALIVHRPHNYILLALDQNFSEEHTPLHV